MLPSDKFNEVGEHPFFFKGKEGQLEALLTIPGSRTNPYLAILGHPHSLQGGTMNNKVVTTLARAFKELNIPSIRFNFRGVGQSEGCYDAGIGESEDMIVLMELWKNYYPDCRFLSAGFSFGSYVAYRAASLNSAALLISIAPPVHHYNYQEFSPTMPWFILQGDEDEVSPLQLVLDFAENKKPALPLSRFPETGHFFHGKLLVLKTEVMKIVHSQVLS